MTGLLKALGKKKVLRKVDWWVDLLVSNSECGVLMKALAVENFVLFWCQTNFMWIYFWNPVCAGCTVLSCELIWCVYCDTKWRWWCFVSWLHCTELRVDMVCVWWHHPNGVGGVVCAGCTVTFNRSQMFSRSCFIYYIIWVGWK
jgi:hypothetical protein